MTHADPLSAEDDKLERQEIELTQRQNGYQVLKAELKKDAAKLAMFNDLVCMLARSRSVIDRHCSDGPIGAEKFITTIDEVLLPAEKLL